MDIESIKSIWNVNHSSNNVNDITAATKAEEEYNGSRNSQLLNLILEGKIDGGNYGICRKILVYLQQPRLGVCNFRKLCQFHALCRILTVSRYAIMANARVVRQNEKSKETNFSTRIYMVKLSSWYLKRKYFSSKILPYPFCRHFLKIQTHPDVENTLYSEFRN